MIEAKGRDIDFISINLYLTHLCNFSCYYCSDKEYNDTEKFKKEFKYMDITGLEIFLNNYNQLVNTKLEILLLGGEPTLHPQFLEIVELLSKNHNIFKVSLITNGSADMSIYKSTFDMLKDKLTLSISYHPGNTKGITHYEKIFKELTEYNIPLNIKYVLDNRVEYSVILEEYNITKKYSDIPTIHPLFFTKYDDKLLDLIKLNYEERKRFITIKEGNESKIVSEYDVSISKDIFKGMKCDALSKAWVLTPDLNIYTLCNKSNLFLKPIFQKDFKKFINSLGSKTCEMEYCNCRTYYRKYK